MKDGLLRKDEPDPCYKKKNSEGRRRYMHGRHAAQRTKREKRSSFSKQRRTRKPVRVVALIMSALML